MSDIEFDFMMCAIADYDEDGHAQIQTDSPGVDGSEGTHPAEMLTPLGFHARPLDPERGSGTDIGLGVPVLCVTSGDFRYVIPWNDPRDVGKLPKLRKGGTMLSGGAGELRSFAIFDGLDPSGKQQSGSFTLVTSYLKGGAKKSLGFSMNVRTSGEEEISIVHGEGHRITMGASGSRSITLANAAGDAYVEIGDDGNVIAGPTRVQGGLTVGEQLAALPVASGPVTASMINALVIALNGVSAALAAVANIPGPIVPGAAPGTHGGAAAVAVAATATATAVITAAMARLNTLHLKST